MAFGAFAQPGVPEIDPLHIDSEVHDFGTVTQGEMALFEIKFTNPSRYPLMITRITTSGGCFATQRPEDEVINPGQTDVIKVKCQTMGVVGPFNKKATITYEGKFKTVALTGTVIAPAYAPPVMEGSDDAPIDN